MNVMTKTTRACTVALVVLVALMGGTAAQAGTVYGSQRVTGTIYAVDTVTGVATYFADTGVTGSGSSPNGNAWDRDNGRFYYSGPGTFSDTSGLYFVTQNGTPVFAGDVAGSVSNGTFHAGAFYYLANDTDDLYKVTFQGDGTIDSEVKVDDIVDNTFGIRFGDIVFDDSVIIGRGRDIGTSEGVFFRYSLITDSVLSVVRYAPSTMYQLAWDGDDLVAHETGTGDFFTMDINTGALTPLVFSIDNSFFDTNGMTDLASFITVPTPASGLWGLAGLSLLAARRRR